MLKLFKYIALSAVLTTAPASWAVPTNLMRGHEAEAARYADSVYVSMTDRQRVGQLIIPSMNPTQGEQSRASVKLYIDRYNCGGLLFSEGSEAQYRDLIEYANALSATPLLMTLDGEWGPSMRIKSAPHFPRNIALGAITDYRLLYDYGREVAREAKALGINVNFAPVADVNINPANPVIGTRSFGSDPERVAKAVVAYSLGLEDGGVQAVAKHFPGHGDTEVDSHKAMPTVHHSRAMLDSIDLYPFASFTEAGCSGIMTGHLSVPTLDASGTPASVSKLISTDVLRNELGFDGLVYTDALTMHGVSGIAGNQALEAMKAGADVLLSPPDLKNSINVILKALETGALDRSVLEDRCKRILRYKYLLNLPEPSGEPVSTPEAEALIKQIASASITVASNRGNILPLANHSSVALVSLGQGTDEFTDICRHYAAIEHFTGVTAENISKIKNCDVIIAAVSSDKAVAREAYSKLVSLGKPVAGVFFINPFKIEKFGSSLADSYSVVVAYDNTKPFQTAAAEALWGGTDVKGSLPIDIPGFAKAGTGFTYSKSRLGFSSPVAEDMASWLTDSIDALVNEGLHSGAFPGCQVLVARKGNIVFDKAYGKLTANLPKKVDRTTIYDLASVSKATGTLSGIMKAYDDGLIRLDDRLGTLIPEITDSAKREITVRELLYHETGMPASLNVYDAMFDTLSFSGKLLTSKADRNHGIKIQRKLYGHNTARLRHDILGKSPSEAFPIEASKGIFTGKATYDTLMHRIYNIGLRPTKEYNYSCLNFCLLMDIEQRLTGRGHDKYVAENIFEPLGAYRSGYRPLTWTDVSNIAPTEYDSFLRRQTLRGYVHDELANFSGGVQGNAGFFANADDIAKYCQMLLNGGQYGGQRILSEATTKLFTTDKSPTCRRGLGFDKADMEHPEWSPTCDEASASLFGHLGFTGTVFWVDPEQEMIFVFLTNRVNPTRDNAAFNRLSIRPRLMSLVYRAIK